MLETSGCVLPISSLKTSIPALLARDEDEVKLLVTVTDKVDLVLMIVDEANDVVVPVDNVLLRLVCLASSLTASTCLPDWPCLFLNCVALPVGLASPSGLAYALLHRLAGLASSSTCITFPAGLTSTTPQLHRLANLASPSTATPRPPCLFLAFPLTASP